MQIDGRSTQHAHDAGSPPAVSHAPQVTPVATMRSADSLELKATAITSPEAAGQASELTQLMDELRAVARAQGEDFPPLTQGPVYGLTSGTFAVPLDKAVQRARDYGMKQPRDFVLGEIAVQLGRARVGYDRTDNRIRQSAGLRVLVELVETVHAARAISTRYEALAPAVQAHVTTIWSAMADSTVQSGSEAIRCFMLTCLAKGLGNIKPPTVKLDEHSAKVIEVAAELFVELTNPPTREEQQRLDGERGEADSRAAKRIERICTELVRYFGELVELAMPEKPAAAKQTTLVSAEEARARNQERAAARQTGPTQESADAAKADSARVISGIKHHDLASRWADPEAPTPSEIQAAIESLVDRGAMKRPTQLDTVVDLVLRSARTAPIRRPSFGVKVATGATQPPWSLTYMRQLTGPDFHALLDAEVADVASRELEAPRRPGGLGRLFDDRSRSNEAQDWVASTTPRIEDLKGMTRIAGELRRHDGVTAQIAGRLQELQREIMESFDECRRLGGRLAKTYDYKEATHFATMRARIETLFAKHEATMSTLRSVATESGTFKRLLRMTVGAQSGLQLDGVLAGVGRVLEAQAPAREYLEKIAQRFPTATAPLMEVLGPRLDWFQTAVVNAGTSRQSDPLLPIFDGAWLGTVTAELRRAEHTATRIVKLVDQLPDAERNQLMVEVGSEEALRAAMIESAARGLAERLGSKSAEASRTVFDVAAIQSRALPALAARPRLGYLCAARGIVNAPVDHIIDIDRFASLALRDGDRPAYSIEQEQRRELNATASARGDYNFWCRTFDLDAPPRSFVNELLGWRTYQAPALEEIVARVDANADDQDLDGALGEAARLGAGTHPVADLEGRELSDRFARIDSVARRLATSVQALGDLAPLLDAATQPVAVLLQAAAALPRSKDKAAAVALVTPWLRLADVRLREGARKCIAEIEQLGVDELMIQHLRNKDDRLVQLLTINDIANLPKASWALEPLEALTRDQDGVLRTFAAHGLASIAASAKDRSANEAGGALVRLLGHGDVHVVEMACEGLRLLADTGNAFTSKLVVDWTLRNPPHAHVAGLLEHIAESGGLIENLRREARGARANVITKLGGVLARPRTSTAFRKIRSQEVGKRDLASTILSAARATQETAGIEAVSDRLKLALRLVTNFERWAKKLGPELVGALDNLDYPDGIVDDAIAELAGKKPRGYLARFPELVSAMFSSSDFSAAEICVLETGRIPEALVALANHPIAEDGSWRTAKLTEAFADQQRFEALVKLKLALSSDLPELVGEVLAIVLDKKTPSAIASTAYDAICDVLSCDIPLLDPKLDVEQRKQAIAEADPLDPAIDALVERAVVDRLAVVEPTSDEAKALVQYLASGDPEAAQARLSDAIDRATSEPQARLILEPARALARRRSSTDANQPWLTAVLRASPRATIDQIVTVRDARRAAAAASDLASVALAGDRVAALAAAVLDKREDIPADQLAPLLGILADSEDDASRQAKLTSLREIFANKDVPWTTERMIALRNGLLVVQANHRIGAIERSLEQAIRFAGRLLDAHQDLSNDDLGKHFEILARCTDTSAKAQYADNVVKMYRIAATTGATLSPVFIEQLGLWIATADAGVEPLFDRDRKRELILSSVAELLPVDDATMTQLVQSCAAMSLDRTAEVLRACKQHTRQSLLTADDVKRMASTSGDSNEGMSFFDKLLGSRVSLLRWKPGSSSFNDPLKDGWNDSIEIKDAKRALRRSLGDFFDTLAAPRGQTADVEQVTISNHVGAFAFGAWSRGQNEAKDAAVPTASSQPGKATVLSSADYAAHKANSDRIAAAARSRLLDGKHPVEQLSMLMMPNSTAIARAFDGLHTKTVETEWEPAATGPRININRLILSELHRIAAVKAAEEAEARGESVNLIVPDVDVCERPREIEVETKNVRLLVNLVIDSSLSTQTDNRLGYFKQLAVMMLNAFGAVENLQVDSSLVRFSDSGQLLMAPARKHDIKTMCEALGPVTWKGGTNMADGLDKARLAASTGTYDKVIHIVLTDGQPNNLGDTQAAVATLRSLGHVVVGFGVGPDALQLGNVFGDEHAISESNPDLIAGRVYNYLKEVVARAAS